jgi:hypothetical protein
MKDTNGNTPASHDDRDEVLADRPSVGEPARDDVSDKDEQTLRDRAEAIRVKRKYRGKLTLQLFNELAPLLVQKAPVAEESEIDRDKGFPLLLVQKRVMDDVLSPIHWRDLTHFEDGGSTARAWVVVGNRLGRVKLDLTNGELVVPEEAEIIKCWDAPGGRDTADSKGELLKSTRTSALGRLLAEVGPCRDAFSGPFQAVEARRRDSRPRYRPDLTAIAGIGEPKADELDVKLLLKIIRDRGLPPRQVANLIRASAGGAPVSYPTEGDAREFVDERLNDRRIVLARDVAPALKRLLEEATPELPVPASTRPTPGGGGVGVGAERGRRTVPFDPTTAHAA